ncbi:RIP metalloprotease RseP [Tabrizicola sp.]|jgi:regulator of sigma E protease|uniref:RIP metalloprotease RseP n=1 Tax=Tabrizicola sp. TaxID=2005166 RepID=UPI001A55FE91|nr:RIP metalloprotease RseP [Tabrizicola sp.]MBL9061488.1 RIP metalloprotease RseP [Tabrizicola sp.]
METIVAALGGTVWTVAFFVIALSVIVFVHEYGHYIVGRWSGIHSEVFSIGFGPVLFSRTDKRGTRWQVAAIPFGGYVKFLGDADGSSVRKADVSGLSAAERRHTMAGAPLWARAATVVAGPFFNFILTFVLLSGLALAIGVPREEPTVGAMRAFPFEGPSLQEGDVIRAVEGQPTPDWERFAAVTDGLKGKALVAYTVQRGSEEMVVNGPHPLAPVIGDVQLRSAAMDAGLQEGDVILKAGGKDVRYFDELPEIVTASKGEPVTLTVWRDGKTFEQTLTPRIRTVDDGEGGFTDRYLLGLYSGMFFEPATRSVGPGEAATNALTGMWTMTTTTFSGLWHMIQGAISSCNLSGAIGMAEVAGDAARNGAESFVGMLAILSLGIGILNLFPIPVLDGGHLVFFAYEAMTRRQPSEGALRVLMTVGLTLVLSIMIFGLSRDLMCQ